MKQAVVKSIGNQALSPEDRIIILFGEEVTAELKKVSVIQKIENPEKNIQLKTGGHLTIDDQEYTITHVGPLANDHLNSIGHVSLVFHEVPAEDTLVNALYLEPYDFPTIKEGTIIKYE